MYYAYQPYHASVTSRIHVTFSFQLISCENGIYPHTHYPLTNQQLRLKPSSYPYHNNKRFFNLFNRLSDQITRLDLFINNKS
ncbi:unnamed protein product [Rhizophagus irregularis]|nr:unnamed protein product [Rhizophagus irregularis]